MSLIRRQKRDTEPWVRNKADELAVDQGCWFDPVRAAHMVWWVERHCRLYEGEWAGEPLIFHSVAAQPADWLEIPERYPDFYDSEGQPLPEVLDFYVQRIKWHNELLHSGAHMHWQFECHCRIYGWQKRPSHLWARRGIEQVRRFRKANVFIAKKNGKSPSLAANVCYLTFGDGEQGGKTFIGAKDGKQAGIVWQHSERMVSLSPELQERSTTNLTTKRILDAESYSFFEPLSSSNSRTQDAKEGLNGNLVIDEVHVVDRQFMAILKYAGASRAQPLHLEFSTAGSNPDSYGKEQWDLGEAVNDGSVKRTDYFHASYHAPQKLSEAEMDRKPEKYIRLANPAVGHTVDMDELKSSWASARTSPYEVAEYFKYRLDIWQHSAAKWLSAAAWDACARGYTLDDMRGKPCGAGLDLARRWDMAALVLAWPNDTESVDLWPFFWLPEDTAAQRAHLIPDLLKWARMKRSGYPCLRLTPGNTIDMGLIKREVYDICRDFEVRVVAADGHYASDLLVVLEQGEVHDGDFVIEPLPLVCISQNQGILTQTAPTTDLGNDVIASRLGHPGHPVLDWQVGNARVTEDTAGNIKIVKESRKSPRSVDGAQAAVMARWAAVSSEHLNVQLV